MAIIVDKSIDKPMIYLNEEKPFILIEGNSYPADVYKAYRVVFDWINEYSHQIGEKMICQFKFNILNSSSRKMVYEIISTLDKSMSEKVEVHWYYDQNDDDIREAGEIMSNQLNLPFWFIKNDYQE